MAALASALVLVIALIVFWVAAFWLNPLPRFSIALDSTLAQRFENSSTLIPGWLCVASMDVSLRYALNRDRLRSLRGWYRAMTAPRHYQCVLGLDETGLTIAVSPHLALLVGWSRLRSLRQHNDRLLIESSEVFALLRVLPLDMSRAIALIGDHAPAEAPLRFPSGA